MFSRHFFVIFSFIPLSLTFVGVILLFCFSHPLCLHRSYLLSLVTSIQGAICSYTVLSFRSGLWGYQAMRGRGVNLGSLVSGDMRKIRPPHSEWKRGSADQTVLMSIQQAHPGIRQATFLLHMIRGFSPGSAGWIHRKHLECLQQRLVFSPITLRQCPLQTLGLRCLLENSRLHSCWVSLQLQQEATLLFPRRRERQDHELRSYSPPVTCICSLPKISSHVRKCLSHSL